MQSILYFRVKNSACKPVLLCVMLASILAGCTVGPNFKPPEQQPPANWSATSQVQPGESSVPNSNPADLVNWWKSFNDPVLASLVERAIRSNLDLKQAEARIRQERAARAVAGAAAWPTVATTGSYTRSGSGGGGGARGNGGADQNLFQIGLDAAWELDIFGGTRRNIEAATADLQTAREDRRDVLVTLISDVGTNYINLRGFQQQIAIAEQNLKAQRHTADITSRRFGAGYVGALDVANAKAQVATTESQVPTLESSAQASIYSLSVLLGSQPAALVQELSEEKPIPTTPPEIPVGIPSDLLRRRPDIRRAEAQLHAATARIGVATADLFPKFSLTGNFGTLSTDIGNLGNWASRTYSLGPTISWPIFDAGKIRANIEVQNALQEQSLLGYQKTVLTAFKDVETALTAYIKEQEHWKALTESVVQNLRAVDLSSTLYVAGKTDFLNVLNAERSLYLSEDALVQSTRTLATDLIALYKALGGGWETEK